LKDLKIRINKISNKIIRNNKYMFNEIGKMAAFQIAKRTRLGKGLNGKFKPLSENYKEWRKGKSQFYTNKKTGQIFKTRNKRWIRKPSLHSETTPNKSNLTLSGDMIDAITYKSSRNKAVVKFSNSKAKQKAQWAHDGAPNRPMRKFFGLTDLEEKTIQRWLKDYLVKEIKKQL
jgi:phage gpG-like protein